MAAHRLEKCGIVSYEHSVLVSITNGHFVTIEGPNCSFPW
jgi:hypothetical protein